MPRGTDNRRFGKAALLHTLAALCALSSPANSQQFPPGVPDPASIASITWERFKEVCGNALSAPLSYFSALPPRHGDNYASLYQTPDNSHILANVSRANVAEAVGVFAAETGHEVLCEVTYQNRDGLSGIGSLIPYGSEIYSQYADAIASGMEDALAAEQEGFHSGGAYTIHPHSAGGVNGSADVFHFRAVKLIAGELRTIHIDVTIFGPSLSVRDIVVSEGDQ